LAQIKFGSQNLEQDHGRAMANLMHRLTRKNSKSKIMGCLFKNNKKELEELKKQLKKKNPKL